LFDLPTISTATNGFSDDKKIGKGGFGAVYKVIQYLSIITRENTTKEIFNICVSPHECDYVGKIS